jgi:diaminopimelate decarboxylase
MPSKIKAKAQPTFASVLLGPTGESVDTVAHATLPLLAVGDWLYFRRMGAFAAKASAVALGFGTPDVRYINSWNG